MMISYMSLEGEDFGDDIFATPNSAPQGSAPKLSNAPNTTPASGNAPNIAPELSIAPHAALKTSGMTGLDGGDGTE